MSQLVFALASHFETSWKFPKTSWRTPTNNLTLHFTNVGFLLHLVPLPENVEAVADHWRDATATVAQGILVGLKLAKTLEDASEEKGVFFHKKKLPSLKLTAKASENRPSQ